ncbi:hypothetical protein LTR85_009250 [Meristemomyces frigidus]|nr:hypothetical protein LTR85_009250 [Meristemomyces frigidus]
MELPDSLAEGHRLILVSAISILLLAAWLLKRATSPIARLPGPFLTKFSVLPVVYQDYNSNRTNWTNELHAKYGPLVRLSPTEVAICSLASIRDVFTGSAESGYYDKAPIFNIFQHFGARNAFSSIAPEAHSWRRKVVAGNYAQTAIVAKEVKHGNLWRAVGDFLGLIEREGMPTVRQGATSEDSKSADVFSAVRFYSADNISAHLFVEGFHALDGDVRTRKFIEASAELPDEVTTYLKMEFETLHSLLLSAQRLISRAVGVQSRQNTGRSRTAKASGKKVPEKDKSEAAWYGGTEIRDVGFKRFIASREALEAGDISATAEDPVSARLAANVLAGESAIGTDLGPNEDAGLRFVLCSAPGQQSSQAPTVFYRDQGCASECMAIQETLRKECQSLNLPPRYNQALHQDRLMAVQTAPYLDAVLKETLRRFPASTTSLQRVVPDGGRILDGLFVPGSVTIGASPVTTNIDADVFDRYGKCDVADWAPARWLDADEGTLGEMNRRMWTFGSGGRGCVGKHLAMLEMKLLIAGIYSRYATSIDQGTRVPPPQGHPSQRTTFRDIDWFKDARGVLAFSPLIAEDVE